MPEPTPLSLATDPPDVSYSAGWSLSQIQNWKAPILDIFRLRITSSHLLTHVYGVSFQANQQLSNGSQKNSQKLVFSLNFLILF